MSKRLFLLDGMALVYRGHFALISRPIFTSTGVNTSALHVFTQTLLDILTHQEPTHVAVAFDTAAPTQRHRDFADYKAQRQEMPEDIVAALPHVRRLIEAFNIRILTREGFEADDIIGTLVRKAQERDFTSYMVTPDKDFAQLVSDKTLLYRPGRMGEPPEIWGVPEVLKRWGIQRPEQVIDHIALWGDASDNIPGVPGIGEKTAVKLIGQYGSVEAVLSRAAELKGKLREKVQGHREQALLSRKLATIVCDVPCDVDLDGLKLRPRNDGVVKEIFAEFEFNALGRRLFGDEFRAVPRAQPPPKAGPSATTAMAPEKPPAPAALKNIRAVEHHYGVATNARERSGLLKTLQSRDAFAIATAATNADSKRASLLGLAFSIEPRHGVFAPFSNDPKKAAAELEEFRPLLEDPKIGKTGHDLKFVASVLKWHGITLRGGLFDTMIAHALIEPDMRHSLEFLAEVFLRYSPIPISNLIGDKKTGLLAMGEVPLDPLLEHAVEDADLNLQLRLKLEPLLEEKKQERVFYEIEMPLLPVLVDMEVEGIRVDAAALAKFAERLYMEMARCEREIHEAAGRRFNINSPRQLGEVLFDVLKLCEAPKKTATGQYATDEQTLAALAPRHGIVRRLLDYRMMSKLKSTYADVLPGAVWPRTGRIHTTYNQMATATGRLNSVSPNLQNIPIRTGLGREIRKAFVPRDAGHLLLSADYSQIELRIIAALSREAGLLDAFKANLDIHTATAARVFGAGLDEVTPDMRRKAKMINYGIAYGISAFGLSQRLGIPRAEGQAIIDEYFRQFPSIRAFMAGTVEFARKQGYVQTVSGRRRYIRDINSRNATIRNAAERNAINAPIQGTAADMIKLAMIDIHRELEQRRLRTRMLLQVHDELVFDLEKAEEDEVRHLIEGRMKSAIALEVPIVVEIGSGQSWLEAH